MRADRRMPLLVVPFALIGLAAGWLSAGLLAHPLVHRLEPERRGIAALAGCAIGAVMGLLVSSLAGPRAAERSPWGARIAFVVFVLAGGAGAGAVVASGKSGAIPGVVFAAAFLPVCGEVLAAARRASRARMGSIVAGADRRAVFVILGAALAATSMFALLDWPAAGAGEGTLPVVPLGLAGSAGAAIVGILIADVIALRTVKRARVEAATMQRHDAKSDAVAAGREVDSLDLGLGGAVRARLARGASAYRTRERVLARIVGSHRRARAAVLRAIGRDVLGLAVVGATLGAHAVAAGESGTRTYRHVACFRGDQDECAFIHRELACEAGEGASCRAFAHLVEWGTVTPSDPGRALLLLREACELGDADACDELPALPIQRAVVKCMKGEGEACAAASGMLLRVGNDVRAAHFARVACRRGVVAACE